tara:strand:+ start:913 stop:2340 length:1428 start_codon:yes stop_codon:yes gene_type:complete
MSYSSKFSTIRNLLWKDDGCNTEVDYLSQFSWILFLKYLEDFEEDLKNRAILDGKQHTPILDERYMWSSWGRNEGKNSLIDDDLISFVSEDLFPYLRNFKTISKDTKSIQYKVGQIFDQIKFLVESGNILRDVLDEIDGIEFFKSSESDELSDLYEESIKQMGNSGTSAGQYYTPRPLINSIVKAVNPTLGETVLDPACGSGGFLISTFEHILNKKELTAKEFNILQKDTVLGQEKIGIPFAIGIMNMIMHGIETPNIIRDNTLSTNTLDLQDKDRVDVIVANPPFGGSEREEIKSNFAIQSSETAYLFMQYFLKKLKIGGRAGLIIKNTFLSNDDAASLRQLLLKECNLHTIVDLPKVFGTTGVQTVALFFEKGKKTKDIFYYQLNLDRNIGKTNPLNKKDLEEFDELFQSRKDSKNSWKISINDIDKETWDISPSNPNVEDTSEKRKPSEILAEIEVLDKKAAEAMAAIKELL